MEIRMNVKETNPCTHCPQPMAIRLTAGNEYIYESPVTCGHPTNVGTYINVKEQTRVWICRNRRSFSHCRCIDVKETNPYLNGRMAGCRAA